MKRAQGRNDGKTQLATAAGIAVVLLACGCPGDGSSVGGKGSGEADGPPPFVPPPEPPPGMGGPREPEMISLLGNKLFERRPDVKSAELQANLDEARAELEEDPGDPEKVIWVARRLGYLWRMNAAIEVLSKGIEQHPEYAPLYRHRGHRYISTRQFAKAIADLEKAAALIEGTEDEVEPDGAPNERGIPLSSLHFNVWYHLALARYLEHDFEGAEQAWRTCLALPQTQKHDDNVVAVTDWLYMTLRRQGKEEDAEAVLEPIRADMEIIENASYHRRCLMYKGEVDPESLLGAGSELDFATQGYGLGNWYLYAKKNEAEARRILRAVIETDYWPAFGHVASEVDLKMLLEKKRREKEGG